MSSISQDIKSGLKGIKGAGDAIRGKAMQAGDELLDPKGTHNPETAAAQAKNRAIADQGMADVKAVDTDIGGRHGAANHTVGANAGAGNPQPGSVAETAGAGTQIGAGAPTPTTGTHTTGGI